jgi:hypothetical protein
VSEHDLPPGFAIAQKADGLTIREEQIRKFERDGVALRQYVDRLTQLVNILCVESPADVSWSRHGNLIEGTCGRDLNPFQAVLLSG